jgi:hypothetical protein
MLALAPLPFRLMLDALAKYLGLRRDPAMSAREHRRALTVLVPLSVIVGTALSRLF